MAASPSHQGVDDEHGPNKIDGNLRKGEATMSHHLLQHWSNKKPKSNLINMPCADWDAIVISSYHGSHLMQTRSLYKDIVWDLVILSKSR